MTEYRNNITTEKRLRMTWETEMTVSVSPSLLGETLNRVERALQDGLDFDEIEGRFYWQRGGGKNHES